MSDWDADDYDPPSAGGGSKAVAAVNDKWEGEDEEDDVKDAWDADSDEEKSEEKAADAAAPKPATTKKNKKLRDKIALKEAAAAQEEDDSLSPEDKLAEKLRLQKMEENAQYNLTRDMLGLKTGSIDSMVPATKEDFENFAKAICEKIRAFSSSDHYNGLLETVTKDLALDMPVPSLKKVKIHVEGLHSTRLKEEKASKNKKAKGTAGRTSLKNDLDKDLFGGGRGGVDDFGDDMDDFM